MVLLYRKYGNDAISITHLFLKMMGVRTSLSIIKDFFNAHLYKDTLFCIQDFIADAGLQPKTIKYNRNDIEKVPTPFIAILNSGSSNQNKFAIVSKISEAKVKLFDTSNYKWKNIDKPVFFDQWTKVALLAEDRRSEVVKQASQRTRSKISYLLMQVSIVLMIVLLLFRFSVTSGLTYLISALNILGMGISYYLVKLDFGYNNNVTNKFCNINSKFSCNEILGSKGASIFNIKWVIIGLAYFAANFLLSVSILIFIKEYVVWLFVFNCFPLLFVLYSIFYQWFVERKWCLLCLLIQGILVSQFLLLLLVNSKMSFSTSDKGSVFNAFLIMGLTHLLSLYIINFILIKKYQFVESTKIKFAAYKKALLNPYVFNHFSFGGKVIDAPDLGIFIGSPKASNRILLVSSPSCKYCSDYILDLLSLVRSGHDIYVQILFLCHSLGSDGDEKVVNYFMNLQKQQGTAMLCDALYYWAFRKTDFNNYINMFPLSGTAYDYKADIEKMASWCTGQNINSVPALFVNGQTLPYIYDIKDLKFTLQ